MFAILVVFLVASRANGQDQSLSTVSPSHLPLPFMDLFTGASSIYSEPIRKSYSDSYVSCPKPDALAAFANILGSAAKIMLSAAIIASIKVIVGKLLLLPLVFVLVAKAGLKAFLLWPMISKMIKYFKKKKKKGHKSRMITDCSQRIACVIQKSLHNGLGSNIGAAATFFLIDDLEEDSSFAKSLLTILSGDDVAQCMLLDCSSGINIS